MADWSQVVSSTSTTRDRLLGSACGRRIGGLVLTTRVILTGSMFYLLWRVDFHAKIEAVELSRWSKPLARMGYHFQITKKALNGENLIQRKTKEHVAARFKNHSFENLKRKSLSYQTVARQLTTNFIPLAECNHNNDHLLIWQVS